MDNITDTIAAPSLENITFAFSNLSYIDQLAYIIPHKIYLKDSPIIPEVINGALILLVSIAIVIVGSYSTVSRPSNSEDPRLDRKSPYWDPSDVDNTEHFVANKMQLYTLGGQNLGLVHVLLMPLSTAGTLYFLNYVMNNWNIDDINLWLNRYILAVLLFSIYGSLEYVLVASSRKLSKLLGGPLSNSSNLFCRYRLTLTADKDDNFPLGRLENFDEDEFVEKELKKDPKWNEAFQKYLSEEKIEILRPTSVRIIPKVTENTNWIFDLKPAVILPLTIGLIYLFYKYNPILNSEYNMNDINWLVLDSMAINFAIFGIQKIKFGQFKYGFLLLSGLFFYDIYFVFGTEIMEKVATGLNIPMKILLPHPGSSWGEPLKFSLLGLGDIIVPGTVASLSLRFDVYRHHQKNPSTAFHYLTPIAKPYFTAAIVSYFIGLAATLVMLNIFRVGQPALLYIVPSLLGGITITGLARREFTELWEFKDEIKQFDEKDFENENENYIEEEDEDYILNEDEASFDDWVDQVELERAGSEDETDLDEFRKFAPKRYTAEDFGPDDEEEDDDTFVIGEGSDDELDDDDDIEEEEVEYEEDDDEAVIEVLEELQVIREDLNRQPQRWYSDEE